MYYSSVATIRRVVLGFVSILSSPEYYYTYNISTLQADIGISEGLGMEEFKRRVLGVNSTPGLGMAILVPVALVVKERVKHYVFGSLLNISYYTEQISNARRTLLGGS